MNSQANHFAYVFRVASDPLIASLPWPLSTTTPDFCFQLQPRCAMACLSSCLFCRLLNLTLGKLRSWSQAPKNKNSICLFVFQQKPYNTLENTDKSIKNNKSCKSTWTNKKQIKHYMFVFCIENTKNIKHKVYWLSKLKNKNTLGVIVVDRVFVQKNKT